MTIFTGNLSFDAEQEDLINLFSQYGEVKNCNLPLDREGNRESYDFSEAVVSSTNIDESLFIDVTNI